MIRWYLQVGVLLLLLALTTLPSAESNLQVGTVINLFARYGYMYISMKVIPRNETYTNWIFREPTMDVFGDVSAYRLPTEEVRGAEPAVRVFNGDFNMEFCSNLRQLLQAYFRDFKFENLDRPWRVFTGSWSKSQMAKHMGINASYLSGQHCYVLVRVARHHVVERMRPVDEEVPLADQVDAYSQDIVVGDETSVNRFINKLGSHYVLNYTTGNALYQVFVFDRDVFNRIRDHVTGKGIANMPQSELSSFFSPWFAEHIGEILSTSGNQTAQNWAAKTLRARFYFFTYPTLLRLKGDQQLLRTVDGLLGNEAILSLGMSSLAPVIKDDAKRNWFVEVFDNYLKLAEVNL